LNSLSDASRSVRVVRLGTAGPPIARHMQAVGCQVVRFNTSTAEVTWVFVTA